VLALLVIGGSVLVYAMTGGGPSSAPTVADDLGPAATDLEPAALPPDTRDPALPNELDMADPGAETPPPAGETGGLVDKLELARAARDEERWADMQASAIDALAIDPANAEARQLKAQAERELENRARFDRFQEAVAARDYGQVDRVFQEMGATSVYRLRAQPEHDRVMAQFVDSMADRGAALAERGKCRDLKLLVTRARGIYPEAGDAAQGFVAECERNQQAVRTPERRDPARTTAPAGTEKPVGDMIEEAKQAAKSGNYGLAFRLCEQALELRPTDAEARTVCVIAACNMDRDKAAQRHYARLSDTRKRGVYQLCAGRGIKLE
jgi:hypothetical protein